MNFHEKKYITKIISMQIDMWHDRLVDNKRDGQIKQMAGYTD